MRIREENRNIVLLGAVAFCCAIVAGTSALLEPVLAKDDTPHLARVVGAPEQAEMPDASQVRVVGAPFVPNVNPRQR